MITSSLIYNKNNLLKQQQQNSETTILQYTTSKVNGVKDSFQNDSSWIAFIFFQSLNWLSAFGPTDTQRDLNSVNLVNTMISTDFLQRLDHYIRYCWFGTVLFLT